jgi:hypothetical protein
LVNSRYPRFSATHFRSPCAGSRTVGTPSPEVTVSFCRVPYAGFSQAPWDSHPAHLCRFPVRSPKMLTLSKLFLEAEDRRVYERMALSSSPLGVSGKPFVARSLLVSPPTGLNRAIHQPGSITFLRPFYRNILSGAGILTCFPSPTPFGLGLGTD